jgi:hypothetical protein
LAGDPEVGFRKQMKTQGAVRSAAPTHPASKSVPRLSFWSARYSCFLSS